MKKILFLSNLTWMLIAILIIANASSHKPKAFVVNTPPPTCDPGSVSFMSPDAFLKGLARYRKYQLNAINSNLSSQGFMNGNFEDARSCWYSIDELKSFICFIEKNAQKNGFDPATSDLGIRFYYAAYPDTVHQTILLKAGNFARPAEVNVGIHHTLFMVPTVHSNETKLDEDIFMTLLPRKSPDQPMNKKREIALHPIWDTYIKNSQMKLLILGQAATPSSANQGGLCPPHCPPGSQLAIADALYPNNTIDQH